MNLFKPLLTFALFSTVLIISPTILNNAFAQEDGRWYVGDGAKNDMYVTYKVQEQDTNAGRPFDMTIYFKEYNETGKYWVAPTFVVDQGRVYNGTLHLSDLDLTALGTSQISPEMAKYRSGYSSSLKWLSAFVSKPGQSLTAQNWGKIASIGGSPIAPTGKASITTPAGTFDTTTILFHKGVDNTIWIKDGFPYPIKAQTYADTTTGNPPAQYAFELLATGQGQPKQPEGQEQIPVPPLELRTERGTYIISLTWEPVTITTHSLLDRGGHQVDEFVAVAHRGEVGRLRPHSRNCRPAPGSAAGGHAAGPRSPRRRSRRDRRRSRRLMPLSCLYSAHFSTRKCGLVVHRLGASA